MYYDKNGEKITLENWVKKFEIFDYRRVGMYENCLVKISTVWLGLDHSFGCGKIKIFETMVFSKWTGHGDLYCARYTTLKQAEAGHKIAVKMFRWHIGLVIRDYIWGR